VVESEDEVNRLLAACAQRHTPVSFRAAGTSLSGQAVTDSVLVMLGDNVVLLSKTRLSPLHDETFSLSVSPACRQQRSQRHLGQHSARAGRPRSLIMEAQKSASSHHEGKKPKSEPQLQSARQGALTYYDHL
jgi:FAD binding domain-containing protein